MKLSQKIIKFLLAVLIPSTLLFMPGVAFAGTAGLWFDGGGAYGNMTPVGAQAYISPDNPYVGFDTSSAWAMVANDESGGSYAQTGYLKYYYMSNPEVFTEWYNGSNGQDNQVMYSQYGWNNTSHTYGLQDTNPNGTYGGTISFTYAGSQIGAVYWNNVFTSTYPANSTQYFAEIHNNGDQIMGTTANHCYFSTVQYMDRSSLSWSDAPINQWSTGDSSARLYNTNYSGYDQFQTWDTGSASQ